MHRGLEVFVGLSEVVGFATELFVLGINKLANS